MSKRVYKEPYSHEDAFEIIKNESGTHFDPKLVEVFLNNKEKYFKFSLGISEKSSGNH